jgi:hypothetical protein
MYYWLEPLPPGKADLIPVEILTEIFLLIVQDWSGYRSELVLVCRRWHAIVLSTPGIHSRLTIRRATQKEGVQAFIQSRKSRLDVRVDMDDETDGSDFNAENFHACFMAAAQAASRWSLLNLISPPPHGEYKGVQILQPLVHLESFELACGFGGLVEPLIIAVCRSAPPNLSTMALADPAALPYLAQPAGLHITHILTTLHIQLSKRMDIPVDILPHLHRLEDFEARNLCLPFYPPDTSLPLIHTLRFLYLKSVSVQWMAGHDFPALERCRVMFPHHADIFQTLQPAAMPSCSYFKYHSNDLHPLAQFHLPALEELDVKSGQWNVWSGNPQLVALCPVAAAKANSLTKLSLDIECSGQLLVYMLSLVPRLEHLSLGLARPTALRTTSFQAFIVREPNADGASDVVGPPRRVIAPLCPSLKSLDLRYKRWLRGPDKKALILVFGDIMASRNTKISTNLKTDNSFELSLTLDERPEEPSWSIDKPVKKPQGLGDPELLLGVLVPHGIVPISTESFRKGVTALPLKEAEYLHLRHHSYFISLEFFFTHDHMEMMVYVENRPPLPKSLPCDLPLFRALRVLVVERADPAFLSGHTFHKLERCRVVKPCYFSGASPSFFIGTEMPVCTRIDIDGPDLLAAFKLPQVHELALDFAGPDCRTIWEKRIAVNANLSGLTLLHMKKWQFNGGLIPILRLLPLLETLIISSRLDVGSLRVFLPMGASWTFGLKQTSSEGQTFALLCPRLQSLRVEGQDPSEKPELISILKDIVTLRAKCGFPLNHFTFSVFRSKPGSQFEVVGTNGSFMMERIDLPDEAKEFELDI